MGSGVPTCGFLVDPDGQRGLELAAWTVVESWGAALFGDPCHACGFDWSLTPEQAIAVIAGAPEVFERATAGVDGDARQGGWSVAEYTSHVADNLRQWSERVQAARVAGQTTVAGYDPDQLAIARNYAAIPLSVRDRLGGCPLGRRGAGGRLVARDARAAAGAGRGPQQRP